MTEKKHSPGPWKYSADSMETKHWGSWKHYSVGHDTGRLMPDAVDGNDTIHLCVARVSREEDARLIAAAPEMLSALEDIYSYINLWHSDAEVVQKMRERAKEAMDKAVMV